MAAVAPPVIIGNCLSRILASLGMNCSDSRQDTIVVVGSSSRCRSRSLSEENGIRVRGE